MKFLNRIQANEELIRRVKANFPGKQVQPSYARIEQPILNGQSAYTFAVNQVANQLKTEQKIVDTDVLVASRVGLFIYKRSTSASDEGYAPLQTYPNVQVFANGTLFRNNFLNQVYEGFLSIVRENTVELQNYYTRNFLEVGTTQQSAATNYSEVIGSDSGFANMLPPLMIPGASIMQTQITVNYPSLNSSCLWQNDNASTENRIVLVLDGFVVKSVSRGEFEGVLAAVRG